MNNIVIAGWLEIDALMELITFLNNKA